MDICKSFRVDESDDEEPIFRLKEVKHKGSWWVDRTVLKLDKQGIKELISELMAFRDKKWRQDKYW